MAKQPTVVELRRALLHVVGAINQLREIAGDFPAIDKELRAAADILVPDDGGEKQGAG